MKKKKKYTVNVEVVVHTEIEIKADSYEDAVQQAREIGVKDAVEFETPFNDGNIKITGVWNYDEDNHK